MTGEIGGKVHYDMGIVRETRWKTGVENESKTGYTDVHLHGAKTGAKPTIFRCRAPY